MPFSFLCDTQGTVQGISGITFPSGPFNGTTNIIGGLSNASIANWGIQIVKTRNFATDASGSPIVPIGTTYSTINDVKAACGGAGVIYYDNNGIAVN
jgi:hypothetical protein